MGGAVQFQPRIVVPSDDEFLKFQKLIVERTGIFLPIQKKTLLSGRLSKRLAANHCPSYRAYFDLITAKAGREELQKVLDLITTNETYFFREPRHFEFLREQVIPQLSREEGLRIWSAAASTGEEAYSIAMELSAYCRSPWELIASDINAEVLQRATRGIYPDVRTDGISEAYRRRFCRKGTGDFAGFMRVVPELRNAVQFVQINLMEVLPDLGMFDVIFLRNVMIYFERDTQQRLVAKLRRYLKPGGYLFVGHSESLHGIGECFRSVRPAVYQRVDLV